MGLTVTAALITSLAIAFWLVPYGGTPPKCLPSFGRTVADLRNFIYSSELKFLNDSKAHTNSTLPGVESKN